MSEEMKLKELYKETFSEIHAPCELSRKVMNMSKAENKKTAVSFARKLVAAAALMLIIGIGGEGAVYAATGESLIKKVVLYVNGVANEIELEKNVDEDGTVIYEGTYEVEDEECSVTIMDEEALEGVQLEIETE